MISITSFMMSGTAVPFPDAGDIMLSFVKHTELRWENVLSLNTKKLWFLMLFQFSETSV